MVETDYFGQLVKDFERTIQERGSCWAEVFVNELATRVKVSYLPDDEIVLKGMPHELPPYIVISPNGVFLDPELNSPVTDSQGIRYFQAFRGVFDPRAIGGVRTEEVQPSPGDWWTLKYDRQQLTPLELDGTSKLLEDPRYEYLREAKFLAEGDHLSELAVWDISHNPTRFTLRFHYEPVTPEVTA